MPTALVISVALLIALSACAGQKTVSSTGAQRTPAEPVKESLERYPLAEMNETRRPPNDPAAQQSSPVVVPHLEAPASFALFDIPFSFDRFTLRMDARDMVEVNAMRLKEHNGGPLQLLLEGRTDEIGTEDYNIVLGDRRAHTVKQYLLELGIPQTKIDTISYGRERPVCAEHSEDCWAKNRTVRFVIRTENGSQGAPERPRPAPR